MNNMNENKFKKEKVSLLWENESPRTNVRGSFFYSPSEKKEGSQNRSMSNELIVHTMGSTEDVNKAMTVYEYKDEIIIVDCGLGYPDIFDMPGVDVLIPDFTYLAENSHKIKGLFLTHAHEDHIGAIPYLLQELPDIPIYSSKLVQEILKEKLKDRNFKNLLAGTHFHLFDPSTGQVSFQNFKIQSFGLNHSVPEAQGFCIDTPEGRLMHIAEYKFDDTPILDKPIDVAKIDKLSKETQYGVLCLISDCLLSTAPGSTKSEKTLSQTFFDLFAKVGDKQVFVTTISSNISRMYQIADAAIHNGRKIVASGRSIEQIVSIARRLGYLPFSDDNFVLEKEASSYDQSTLVYIIAGCYGQPESSLGKLSRGEHKDIALQKNSVVIFSGDPSPPGAEITVEKLTDALILHGTEVVSSEIQENLHVSGHGTKEDIVRMSKLVNPKYFIPVGGTVTRMRAYRTLIAESGFNWNSVYECMEGDSVVFSKGNARKGPHINVEQVYINAGSADQIDPRVVKDRDILSDDGVFVVVVAQDHNGRVLANKVDVVTRGFIYVKESTDLMDKSKKFITKSLNKNFSKNKNWSDVKRMVEKDLNHFLYKETGRNPLIVVHAMTI